MCNPTRIPLTNERETVLKFVSNKNGLPKIKECFIFHATCTWAFSNYKSRVTKIFTGNGTKVKWDFDGLWNINIFRGTQLFKYEFYIFMPFTFYISSYNIITFRTEHWICSLIDTTLKICLSDSRSFFIELS